MSTGRVILPVVILDDTVLFPGTQHPLGVGRPASLKAIEQAMKNDRRVVAVAQRPGVEGTYTMGVISTISEVHRSLGGVNVTLQSESRATLLQQIPGGDDGVSTAVVVVPPETPMDMDDPTNVALETETRSRVTELARRRGLSDAVIQQLGNDWPDPVRSGRREDESA